MPHDRAMTDTTAAEDIRTSQRETWDTFAGGWDRWDDVVQATQRPVAVEMVGHLEITEDQQHLDVAAGTGEPGLTVATLAPRGKVVLADLSAAMLAAAARRAAARGLHNVETRECSADTLPFTDGTFDSVSCRFGLMFVPDITTTVTELARVLRPGGRACVAVWAGPELNPWATLAAAAIATEVEMPAPPPGGPGMFRCAEPGMISAALTAAGLHDVAEWDVPIQLVTDSPQQYWQLVTDCTAPVVAVLSQVDEPTRSRIAAAAVARAREHAVDGKVRLAGTARCIRGTK
jgi:ubiquinone/menaquinone biosynthesis C-methylase UbiE